MSRRRRKRRQLLPATMTRMRHHQLLEKIKYVRRWSRFNDLFGSCQGKLLRSLARFLWGVTRLLHLLLPSDDNAPTSGFFFQEEGEEHPPVRKVVCGDHDYLELMVK